MLSDSESKRTNNFLYEKYDDIETQMEDQAKGHQFVSNIIVVSFIAMGIIFVVSLFILIS